MGVLHAVLTIVVLVLLGGAGYAAVVVVRWRLRNPVMRRIEPDDLRPEIMEILRPLVEEVRDEGMRLGGLQHEKRCTGGSSWGAVSCDSSGTTWSLAQCDRTLFTNEQRLNLTLYTRLTNGMVVVTTREKPVMIAHPESWIMTQAAFGTVREQWEAHKRSIVSYGGETKVERIANYEEFRQWHQQQGEEELEALRNKKLLVTGSGGSYRFAPAKLHLALWPGVLEMGHWIRKVAGPWMLSAKAWLVRWSGVARTKVLVSWRFARSKAKAWMERHRESKARGRKSPGAPDVNPPFPPECPADCPLIRSRQASVPQAETAGALPLEPAAAVSGPYIPHGFGMLKPVDAEMAGTPAPRKSRLEQYREQTSRLTLPGVLGWSLQGMLQCAVLAAFLGILMSHGLVNHSAWLLIGVVLVVHEFGHAVMTKATGFRHRAVFTLPFIGWLATGRKACVSPRKAFWTELMGPLPGLLAGWGILAWNYFAPGLPEWLLDGAFWAVALNTFFLLPVNPLDGGRIADLLFFHRHPYLRVGYYLCAGAALSMLCFVSPILLVLPVVVLAQTSGAFRIRRLTKAVKKAVHLVESEEKALLKTFKVVEKTGNRKLYKRFAWSATIDRLLRTVSSHRLGFFSRASGAAIHLVLLVLPVIALAAYGVTLRIGQSEQFEGAAARMAALEKRVRWIGLHPDAGNRRILERIVALDEVPAPGWQKLSQLVSDLGIVDETAATEIPGSEARTEVLALARRLNWPQVGAWIVEDEAKARSRQSLVTGIVSDLIECAKSGAENGDFEAAGSDLGVAYWAIISCEPRQSFMEWRKWSQLESEVLVALEDLCAAQQISPDKRAWFLKALARAPRPEGPKLALLLLRDLTDGVVIPGDVYCLRELVGREAPEGNPVWNPEPQQDGAELAGDLQPTGQGPGSAKASEDPLHSPRFRISDAVNDHVAPLLGAEFLPEGFKVADQWSAERLATTVPEGGEEDEVGRWNRRLDAILGVSSHRLVVARALGGSRPARVNRKLAGHAEE